MPRVNRVIHEYFENRVVNGLLFSVVTTVTPGDTLRIASGQAVINKTLVDCAGIDLPASSFVVAGNVKQRVDIVVLGAGGAVTVVHGVPGEIKAPVATSNTALLAHISIPKDWMKFAGSGASDEVLCFRSLGVIDTRFQP